jgi:aminopeptidase N
VTPPRSLTQTEAQARAGLLEVRRYDLELDFTGLLEGDALRATSRIDFRCSAPGAVTFLDCVAEVEEATLNGRPLPTGEPADGRIPLEDLDADNELVVRTVQTRTGQAQGVHRTVDQADGLVYVWTTFEPDDARRVFACFDQPDLKAVFGVTAVVPGEWVATSNSCVAEVSGPDHARRWAFPDTPPLSTYNIVANAGPMVEQRLETDHHDLRLYTRRSLAAQLERDAAEIFDLTERGLAFFGEQFGLEFPQRRYDQVFLPALGGAMENYGCVTWDDSFLYRTAPSHGDREYRAHVLLHEMAHMWFGDMVTMRWWDDMWLNESFAEWACHWAAVRCSEFTDAWATQLVGLKQEAYGADLSPMTHPIRMPIPDVETVSGVFDAITYPKGASVLRQLVELVGEEVFVAALRGYFTRHAWSNTTLDDLIHELESASGRDLGGWVEGWLGTTGADRLVVGREGTTATIRVEAPEGRKPLLHRLDVGVYGDQDGDGLVRRDLRQLEVQGDLVVEDVPADALLVVNDGDLTYASVLPDPLSLDLMLSAGGRLPDPLSRSLAVTTAWDLMVRGSIGAPGLVRCAVDVLRHETAASVVEPLLRLARIAADLWAPPSSRDVLLTEVADLALALTEKPEHRLAGARTLAATATTTAQLDALSALVAGDVDLRWRRLTRLAELGLHDSDEAARLEQEDPDPDAWQSALAARAARPDPEAKREGWERVFNDSALTPTAIGAVATAFWRPGQGDLVRPYADAFLAELPGIGDRGWMTSIMLAATMVPKAGVDEGYLDRLESAARRPEVNETVRQRVLERSDTARRMLRARSLTDA